MKKRVHFIGIGGIGLSALAKFLAKDGYEISGSDIRATEITKDLEENFGAKITIPHQAEAVVGADIVIFSAVIKEDNPEFKRAKELGLELYSRKEALKFILGKKRVYAVGGAHGKSTTSAILASLLPDTNALIGAISKEFGSNVRSSLSDEVVFEADESDESFLNSNPYLAIVTNVEPEHMEYYNYDEKRFYKAYENFLKLAKVRVVNGEDEFLDSLDMESIKLYPSKDIKDIEFILRDGEPFTKFKLKDFGEFEVFGFGEHIALDASLAILAGAKLGKNIEDLRENLKNYKGIKKRFDIIQNEPSSVIVDDYGHHPTEIKATLDALKVFKKKRNLSKIVAIWQPHKYTRTKDNLDGFVKCFEGVDELVILPIWSAGEKEIKIDLEDAFKDYSLIMADSIKRDGKRVLIQKDGKTIKSFDEGLIVGFGAGDITYQIRGKA